MAHSKELAEVVVGGNKCVATKQPESALWESHIIAGIKGKRRKVAIHVGSFSTAVDALDAAVIGRVRSKIELKPAAKEGGVPVEAVDLWDKETRLALYDLPEDPKKEPPKEEEMVLIQRLTSDSAIEKSGFWARVAEFFRKAFSFLVLWK